MVDPHLIPFLMVFGLYGLLFELVHPGAWVPGLIGIACLILVYAVPGDLSFVEIKKQWLQLPTSWLVGLLVVSIVFLGGLTVLAVRTKRRRSTVGVEGLIGLEGVMTEKKVLVNGELWDTADAEGLQSGDRVRICGLKAGMKLTVKKL